MVLLALRLPLFLLLTVVVLLGPRLPMFLLLTLCCYRWLTALHLLLLLLLLFLPNCSLLLPLLLVLQHPLAAEHLMCMHGCVRVSWRQHSMAKPTTAPTTITRTSCAPTSLAVNIITINTP